MTEGERIASLEARVAALETENGDLAECFSSLSELAERYLEHDARIRILEGDKQERLEAEERQAQFEDFRAEYEHRRQQYRAGDRW